MKKTIVFFILVIILLSLSTGCKVKNGNNEETGPTPVIQGTWPYYATPGEAGWNEDLLAQAESYFNSLDSAAVVVVYRDKVLAAWGSVSTEYLTHSVRKSFMSALYGIYVNEGHIDLQATMAQLNIDDDPPLTEAEKQARVVHLLAARSGVYHTAAAETEGMHNYKPARGSHAPGTFWCYNNWDFNALGTIFIQETAGDLYEALKTRIADEIGMEDFQPADGQYNYQYDRSIHPAYMFRISARDCARFGLLFLQGGQWQGKQVIPNSWVNTSTHHHSDSGDYIPGTFYGYMWWVFPRGFGEEGGLNNLSRYRSYAALGAYGQVIQVIPEAELVFVHRVDSYQGNNVPLGDILRLLDQILAAAPPV